MADQTVENGQENVEKEDLWSSILGDVGASSTSVRSSTSKTLLVLGDVCSGKSTLIDRLCQVNPSKKRGHSSTGKYLLSGCSLEYRYIDIKDEETDDYLACMGVWTLDGVVWHSQLLPFVLHDKNLQDTLVLIVVDLAQPWAILESLEKWTEVLNKHMGSLKVPDKQRKAMEEQLVKSFQSYIDPESHTDTAAVGGDSDDVSLPLDENILSCNLGIPIIVVCTKSDGLSQLEKNYSYKDEHFDFIQQHIRKFCLKYGASLVYTSTKDNKNIDTLHKYLVHRAYGTRFTIPASIVDRDAVFIPSGWDSDSRINVLCEQIKHINPREPLTNIITPPPTSVSSSEVTDVTSEDDQVFLIAQQTYLSKAPKAIQPTAGPPTGLSKDVSPRSSSTNLQREAESTKPLGSSTVASGGGGGEQVLANFFNSLLTKQGGPKSRGSKQTPETEKPAGKKIVK